MIKRGKDLDKLTPTMGRNKHLFLFFILFNLSMLMQCILKVLCLQAKAGHMHEDQLTCMLKGLGLTPKACVLMSYINVRKLGK